MIIHKLFFIICIKKTQPLSENQTLSYFTYASNHNFILLYYDQNLQLICHYPYTTLHQVLVFWFT